MTKQLTYYVIPAETTWVLKRAGGVKVLQKFNSREEAIVFAQKVIAVQKAKVRLQDNSGHWCPL